MNLRRFVAFSLACALLTLAAFASADGESADEPRDTRATELKRQGDAAMRRLAYEQALALYRKAWQLEQSPALLYNQGRALEALARYPEALEQLEAFARQAPPELKDRVPKLAELLTEIRGRVSTLELTSNVEGARVLVRQRVVGTTPLPRLRLNAGEVWVEVIADGHHPFRRRVTLPGGSSLRLKAQLASKTTTGLLEISSPVAGATVFVDGKREGSVPVQVVLPAGNHAVSVSHPRYDTSETTAVVRVGETSRLSVPLDQPPGITSRWWFWTGVGVVVVGGAVLTAALLTERDPDEGDIPPGQVSGPLMRF